MVRMAAAGVAARWGIMPAHLEPAFADEPNLCLPVTERLTSDSLLLPLSHEMTEDDPDRVVEELRSALAPSAR